VRPNDAHAFDVDDVAGLNRVGQCTIAPYVDNLRDVHYDMLGERFCLHPRRDKRDGFIHGSGIHRKSHKFKLSHHSASCDLLFLDGFGIIASYLPSESPSTERSFMDRIRK
jgi:hypothetical protein